MQTRRALLGLAMISCIGVACVSQGAVAPATGEHYIITEAELARVSDLTLYEAVLRLRPHFLRSRTISAHGRPATAPVMLYLDGDWMESVDDLRRLTAAEVREVRFYEPQFANARFGGHNNAGGAIAVITKTGS